jgi:starch phosphorylase
MTASHPSVAYFCMEFAVRRDLQLYSGGLGILAGDVLKAAADDGLPFTGIGLFWAEGYVSQRIAKDGWLQQEWLPVPREALEALDVDVAVNIRGRRVPLRAWALRDAAHAELLLLEPRDEADAWITRRLYQGGYGDRIAQELILGVGGIRLLRALGRHVDVVHLNEGHAVFAALEMAREAMAGGLSFDDAVARVRGNVVFTTHTPVMAGNEAHGIDLLMDQGAHLDAFSREDLVGLAGDPFSMTVAALKVSRRANAVAQLHGQTARQMWAFVEGAAPIVGITNGVHLPSWQDPAMRDAFASGDPWTAHERNRTRLVDHVRHRTGVELAFDRPIVAFARRAAAYKRPNLIFRDLERIAPLLENRRMQLVFAGKAYPDDASGHGIVHDLVEMTRRFPQSVVFLPDYGMDLGQLLTRGADVWLNCPLRPHEASGTSGMKAALNGVLNLSILDGWWAEGCEHGVNGWQFGDGYEGPGQDEVDFESLVHVLESAVLPTWEHDRARWLEMMSIAEQMARTRFSAQRMLREYAGRLYG